MPFAVGIGQAAGRLQDDSRPPCSTGSGPWRFDEGAEVLALDVLHHEEVHALVLVGVEGGDDVRMNQACRGVHLALEAADGVGVFHGSAG